MNHLRKLRAAWDKMTSAQRRALYSSMNTAEKAMVATSWEFQARPHQLLPEDFEEKYNKAAIIGGRGSGKTHWLVETCISKVQEYWHIPLSIGMSNKNWDDVLGIDIDGDSGFRKLLRFRNYVLVDHYPTSKYQVRIKASKGSAMIEFFNGTKIRLFSGEKPDAFAGYQYHLFLFDELFLYPKAEEVWRMVAFCMRLTEIKPMIFIASTPRPKKITKKIMNMPGLYLTRPSLYDNAENLHPDFIKEVESQYEGTRFGRQEIHGELLEDNPDALWQPAMIEDKRITNMGDLSPEKLCFQLDIVRLVIAVDPAVTSGEKSDESGILLVGRDGEGRLFVFRDATGRYSPDELGRTVSDLYNQWPVDRVVGEVNNGGDLIEHTLRVCNPNIPYKGVRATKGKRTRAEPVAALYEQGKVHHVGNFIELEEQMCMFTADNFDGSPDRVDALVWGLTELALAPRSKLWF